MTDTSLAYADDADISAANRILASTASDNFTSWRFRTIAKMNPYMADNPGTLMAMASMPLSNEDLFSNAGAIYGMQRANDLAKKLPSYQPSTQRAIFSQLTAQQQTTLLSMGYSVPKGDVHTKGFMDDVMGLALTPLKFAAKGIGKTVGPIVSPTLGLLEDISNAPFAAYRTIRQLDSAEQWIAAAGAMAGMVAGVALIPVTGGLSGTMAAAGIASMSAITGATVASFAGSTILNRSPSRWINAWSNAWNGERLFTNSANNEARRLLENDDILSLAQELAADLDTNDILNIAKDIAGVRDGQRQDVQIAQLNKLAARYGEEGTPEFTQAYTALKDLFLQPVFKQAVNTLANGKISIGRDIVRALDNLPGLELDPANGAGRWISGGIDAASMFFMDPLLFAGGLANKYKIAKYGLNFSDAGVATRFREIAELPKVQRKMDLIADAVQAGRSDLLDRGAREYKAIYTELRAFADELAVREGGPRRFTGKDVVDYIAGHSDMKSIMSGIGIVHGTNYGVVKGIGASQYYFRRAAIPVQEFLRGIDDVRVEAIFKKLLSNDEIGPALIDHLHGVNDEVVQQLAQRIGDEDVARAVARMSMNRPVQEIFETGVDNIDAATIYGRNKGPAQQFLSALSQDDDLAYAVGRIVGGIPIARIPLRGVAGFVKGVTTRVPGGAISFVDQTATEDIQNFVDLFQGYMPSYVRRNWTQAIVNAPSPAARMQGSLALLDSLASSVGMRLTPEGNALLDKFLNKYSALYQFGPGGRITPYFDAGAQVAAGALPIKHMATMFPIPDLKEIRQAVRQQKVLEFLIGQNPTVLAFQNRYWKPAVLLRLGFIFRNAGEEMLGFATRYGFGSLMQEFTARGLAQKNLYQTVRSGALEGAMEEAGVISRFGTQRIAEVDRWIQRSRWDLPAVARPVARAIDYMGKSGRPFIQTLGRYSEWLGDLLTRRADDMRAHFHAGFGFAEGLRKYSATSPVLEPGVISRNLDWDTARNNLQGWWRAVAFGNERSLRRMIIGGVDQQLVRHAERFERDFLKTIMEQVGTSNQAPWQRLKTGTNLVEAVVDTSRGEEIVFVQDLGVREFGTRDNPSPLTQAWTNAVRQRRAELLDDPIAAAGVIHATRVITPDLQGELTPDLVKNVMVAFDDLMAAYDDALDSRLLQLFWTVKNGRFDREKFDAVLSQMLMDTSRVVEKYPGETVLTAWAESRNELVRAIRRAFPGNTKPTWKQITGILQDEKQNPMLTAAWSRFMDSPDFDDPWIIGKGFSKTRNQINVLSLIDDMIPDTLGVNAKNWLVRSMATHYDQPTWISSEALQAWDTRFGFDGSPFYKSFTDAESGIRNTVRSAYNQALSDPEYRKRLQLNARFASDVDSVPLYTIDTSAIASELDEIQPLWRVESITPSTELGRRLSLVLPEGDESPDVVSALQERVRRMLAEGKPLVFTNIESADEFARILGRNLPESAVRRTYVTRPVGSKGAVTDDEIAGLLARQLGINANAFNYQRLGNATVNADSIENFGLLSYEPYDLTRDAWLSFHDEALDRTSDLAQVENIVDTVVEQIRQNLLAGRRAQFYARDDAGGLPFYRAVGGRAERVTPGEQINPNETFFSSEDLNPDSIIKVGDQRYFLDDFPTYEGNNEILWSIIDPIVFDHVEANRGLALYVNKAPIGPSGRIDDPKDADLVRIRYSSPDDVKATGENALPDFEILQVYKPVVENFWDKIVRFGFGRVIGPWIDAIARKPIAFHAFALAADRNTANISWLIRGSKQQAQLRTLADSLVKNGAVEGPSGRLFDIYSELGRLVGRIHDDINVGTWSNLESIAYLRGAIADEPTLLDDLVESWNLRGSAHYEQTKMLSKSANSTLRAAVEDLQTNPTRLTLSLATGSNDEIISLVDRVLGEGSSLKGFAAGNNPNADRLPLRSMTPAQEELNNALLMDYQLPDGTMKSGWSIVSDAAKQRDAVEGDVYKYAAEHAIRDLMPFIDSHEIRSQFADSVSGLLPFWYAEENFLKRWAKMFGEGGPLPSLARVRKLQMTYLGLRTMGVIRQDPQGKDYFVWPGSEIMNETLQKVFGTELPLNTVFQSPTDRVIPGFTPAFGAPQTGPFVSIPLDLVASVFPEAVPVERAIMGDFGMFRSTLEHIIPAQIRNTWEAVAAFGNSNLNGSNERHASAMMTAMQQLEFTPYALPPDATPGQKDEYLRRVRDHARVILLSQALGGWFMPAQTSPLTTANASSLSWLTSGAIENPQEFFSSQYYELISNLGIEEGTIAFLEANADANLRSITSPLAATVSKTTTPSGAPLPTTEEGINFYFNNQELLDQFPDAGPWLLPQNASEQSKRSQYAYDSELITGMRQRRTPEEFLDAMKYKEGAAVYFDSQKRYESEYARLKAAGAEPQAKQLAFAWDQWSTVWKLTHPTFAEMLTASDARQRRNRVIEQMRVILKDPEAPKADHFDQLKVLMDTFDAFMISRSYLALDRTAAGQNKLIAAKATFSKWVSAFVLKYPMVQSFWDTVLSPEAGID